MRVHLEHAAQTGDVKDPQETAAVGDQPEPAAPRPDPLPGPAQDTEARAVDERHGTQVQHQIGVRLRGQGVEPGLQRDRRRELDLAVQRHDGRPVGGAADRVRRRGFCAVFGHTEIKAAYRDTPEGPNGP